MRAQLLQNQVTYKDQHGFKMISKVGRIIYEDEEVISLKLRSPRRIVYWGYSTLLEVLDLSADTSCINMCRHEYVQCVTNGEIYVLDFGNIFFQSLAVDFIFIVFQRRYSKNKIFYRGYFKKTIYRQNPK